MEGKIFSFDLQRFTGEVWSLSGDKYVYGSASGGAIGTTPTASLVATQISDSVSAWSLGGSADVTLDLSTSSNSSLASSIGGSASDITNFYVADNFVHKFSFILNSGTTKLTSIAAGGNSGASIDASAVTNGNLTITGGSGADLLKAGKSGKFYLNGGGGSDTLVGGTGTDYFIFNGTSAAASIQNYTAGTDVVSLGSTGLTIPTGFDSVSTTSSDYVIALGNANSLTFNGASQVVLTQGSDTYTYTRSSIARENNTNPTNNGITLGSSYTSKTFNGASNANSSFVSIDASKVNHEIRVTGNDKSNYMVASSLGGGTLLGGDGADTLVAGSVGAHMDGGDGDNAHLFIGSTGSFTDDNASLANDTFVYRGNTASIQSYGAGDIVRFSASDITITDATVSAASVESSDSINLTLNFDNNDKIIFQSLSSDIAGRGVSLQIGRSNNFYVYKKDSVTWNDKSITLTADYAGMSIGNPSAAASVYSAVGEASLVTIDASLVDTGIKGDNFSIQGNTLSNYIIGSASKANSINGGAGNDTLVGNAASLDVFYYTSGKDVIVDFDNKDNFSIGGSYSTDNITKAKASRNALTFTINDTNSIAFRAGENAEVPERISLSGAGGGFLTADGVVSSISSSTSGEYSLKLFSNANGTINLSDTLYNDTKITSLNAESASNGLTVVAKSVAGTAYYNFNSDNKKRDTFQYDSGKVSITGFESGKDRLYLANDTISSFSINGGNGGNVLISLSSDANKVISLGAAQGKEILVRTSGARGYSKMVFRDSGVLENKAKNPTAATVSANATEYRPGDSVKKITVTDIDNAVSIYAGSKGSVVDASGASKGVSLIGGAKADKFTGSSNHADVFFFDTSNGGKDIINSFVAGTGDNADSIKFGANGTGLASLLSNAKISTSSKAIKFKFGKNVLTVKGNSDIKDATLQIADTAYSYGKNAIINGSSVSLTSAFGGTYKVAGGISTVDGSNVDKNLMLKVTSSGTNETLFGGTKKTTFKGAGGTDSLVGGSGSDIFFYARGDNGTAKIADFDFTNDKLKIASGTLRKIESIKGGGITFDMSTKNSTDDPVIGHFVIESSATYNKSTKEKTTTTTPSFDAANTVIHANNTYYWFAQNSLEAAAVTAASGSETVTIAAGDLITWNRNVSKSDIGNRAVIELNYGTNLVKSGVAVAVSKDKATLPSST